MIYKLQLGQYQVLEILPKGDMYLITFAIHTIHGHSLVPFKPNLKPGDFITLYTEIEHAKEDDKRT